VRTYLPPALLLAVLTVAGAGPGADRARAQPAEPPSPPPAPAEETAPPTPEGPVMRVAGIQIVGSTDPPGRLESLAALLVPPGSPLVEPGPMDRIGEPVGTVDRLEAAMRRLGYEPTVQVTRQDGPGGPAVNITVNLQVLDRIRHIFVQGNWPIRQDEVVRYLTLRPGQALPPTGGPREARLEQERQSVLTFLRDQGYLQAQVVVKVETRSRPPAPVNLVIDIAEGPGFPIGDIRVEGSQAVPALEIAESFRHLDSRFLWTRALPFRLSLMREDRNKLTERYRDLGYAGVRVTVDFNPAAVDFATRQVKLRVDVLERKRVEVRFEGNQRIDDDDLREVITIFSRGSYVSVETQASEEAIAQLYRSKGHLFVKVTSRSDGSAPDVHRISFVINEGPSLRVREVSFQGQQAFPADRLAEVVTARRFPALGSLGIGEGGYASFRQLQLDVERLTAFYLGAGFPDARVRCEVGPRAQHWQPLGADVGNDPAWARAEGLHVRFLVEEGARLDIAEVDFEAPPGEQLPYPTASLLESLDARTGQPFREAVIRSDSDRLQRLMGDAGYPRATVEPTYERAGNRVRLRWKIRLGPPLRVGPLFVRGNFLTSESTILRWTLLRPGDPLTTTALERSQRNLALIQIFNNASPIAFPDEARAGNTLPMLVEVEERHDHWGVARVGAGGSTEQAEPGKLVGWYGALGYEHRNLFGQSWLFLARGELGTSVTRLDAQFTDPRFLGTLFRLNVTGNYRRQATVRLGDTRSGGGTIGFAREMFPGVDASLTYGLRNTIRTEFLVRLPGPLDQQATVSIGTAVGSLALGVDWQRLDNPLVPTRGFRLQAGVEAAFPVLSVWVGEDSFIKATARALNVVPLSRRLGIRHSLRYDQGFPLGGASLLPKVERFSAGGDTTLRGFELDRARTQAVRAELAPNTGFGQYAPVGGNLRLLQNVDLQLHITGPWYGGLFFDTGVVADSLDELSPRDFRHSVGVAPFAFRLPIGDISISWAWPLDPQPGDSANGRLHFNVGLMF
jgi:outer membrane protein insertion porin family